MAQDNALPDEDEGLLRLVYQFGGGGYLLRVYIGERLVAADMLYFLIDIIHQPHLCIFRQVNHNGTRATR
ncbi:hypothetical protein Barb7_02315 [Bacteroidales bacterium Barb7]|nr:hypothetical protein Barb7_02315 [Bacteroidales bacterium Barb7]